MLNCMYRVISNSLHWSSHAISLDRRFLFWLTFHGCMFAFFLREDWQAILPHLFPGSSGRSSSDSLVCTSCKVLWWNGGCGLLTMLTMESSRRTAQSGNSGTWMLIQITWGCQLTLHMHWKSECLEFHVWRHTFTLLLAGLSPQHCSIFTSKDPC